MLAPRAGWKLATLGVYVRIMNTGWREWVAAGYEVEGGDPARSPAT